MTVNFNGIVNALDRLAFAIENNSVFLNECFSGAIGIVCSVAAVVIFEAIKNCFFEPRREFKELRRRVLSTLSMYACYYTNVLEYEGADERIKKEYGDASKEIRKAAVDLSSFAVSFRGRRCCGVKLKDIDEAASILFGLSNNLFYSKPISGHDEIRQNHEWRKEIYRLLKVDKKANGN